MAPEIFQNQVYTFSADMWSVGAIMSFICNRGEHLFTDRNSVLTWPGERNALPRHYSIDLRRLVTDLLHPNPDGRPTALNVCNECTDERREPGFYEGNSKTTKSSKGCTIS